MTVFLQAVVDGIATGAILALVAVGLSLVFRIGRFVNVSHVDLATVAAYGTLFAVTSVALPWPVAVAVGIVAAMAGGFLAERLVFRRLRGARSITLIIASIGVALVLRYTVSLIFGSSQLAYDMPLVRAVRLGFIRISPYDLGMIALAVAIFVALGLVMRFTRFGRTLRAVADNPDLARVSGLKTERALTQMWLIGSALAGIGGILLAAKTVIVPYMGWYLLLPAFAAMILGGVGSIAGTLVGSMLISVASELAATYWAPTYRLAAVFGLIVLVLLVRPTGLFGAKVVAK